MAATTTARITAVVVVEAATIVEACPVVAVTIEEEEAMGMTVMEACLEAVAATEAVGAAAVTEEVVTMTEETVIGIEIEVRAAAEAEVTIEAGIEATREAQKTRKTIRKTATAVVVASLAIYLAVAVTTIARKTATRAMIIIVTKAAMAAALLETKAKPTSGNASAKKLSGRRTKLQKNAKSKKNVAESSVSVMSKRRKTNASAKKRLKSDKSVKERNRKTERIAKGRKNRRS